MASVTLNNVWKNYNKTTAVQNVSLDIENGEFVAFLGPSGCGKSSTMRMIAGLEEVSSGSILLNGEDITHMSARDRNIAMAFENYALYNTLSVYENLAFPLRAAKWAEADLDKRIREIADIVKITHLLPNSTTELSTGQKQAVTLGRALMRKPNVFLLDEPISHLDTSQRNNMRAYLKNLHMDLGYTMIYVTHNQEEAMALADRIVVINNGVIEQVGKPAEVYNHPATVFVAGFVGEPPINLVSCTFDQQQSMIHFDDFSIPLPPKYRKASEENRIPETIILGIRPFYIRVIGDEKAANAVNGEVYVVEPLGDITVVTVKVGETRLQIVTDPRFQASSGQSLWFDFDLGRIIIFDSESERSIATV